MLAFLENIGTEELVVFGAIAVVLILTYGMKPLGRAVGRFKAHYDQGVKDHSPKE